MWQPTDRTLFSSASARSARAPFTAVSTLARGVVSGARAETTSVVRATAAAAKRAAAAPQKSKARVTRSFWGGRGEVRIHASNRGSMRERMGAQQQQSRSRSSSSSSGSTSSSRPRPSHERAHLLLGLLRRLLVGPATIGSGIIGCRQPRGPPLLLWRARHRRRRERKRPPWELRHRRWLPCARRGPQAGASRRDRHSEAAWGAQRGGPDWSRGAWGTVERQGRKHKGRV